MLRVVILLMLLATPAHAKRCVIPLPDANGQPVEVRVGPFTEDRACVDLGAYNGQTVDIEVLNPTALARLSMFGEIDPTQINRLTPVPNENHLTVTGDIAGIQGYSGIQSYTIKITIVDYVTPIRRGYIEFRELPPIITTEESTDTGTAEGGRIDNTVVDAIVPTVNSNLPPLKRGRAKAEAFLGAINSRLQSGSLAPYRVSSCQWSDEIGYQSVLTCFLYPLSRPEFEVGNPSPFITVELDGPGLAIGHSGFSVPLGVDKVRENMMFNFRSSREFMVAALGAVITQYSLNSQDLEESELTALDLARISASAAAEASLIISKLDDHDREAEREHEIELGQGILIRVTKFPIRNIWPDLQLVVTKTD